jgi:hypothetical protein
VNLEIALFLQRQDTDVVAVAQKRGMADQPRVEPSKAHRRKNVRGLKKIKSQAAELCVVNTCEAMAKRHTFGR